ncbi:MAG: ACP S-malonyltransferase [Sandaracinaceae bacterium]|nr:ACP S-malonyltransferase [Sandaracinaceae bacterium]
MARRVALLFPGQGSEEPEMGLALARADGEAAALLAEASRVTGVDAARALARGGRALEPTEVLQPVLLATGLAVARALVRRGVAPAWAAGHSLGELTACCFASDMAAPAAIALAARRGALMRGRAGGMLALDAEQGEVERALERAGASLAAVNAPREIVVSGEARALAELERSFGPRAKRLRVGGPWHSSLLAGAVEPFRSLARDQFENSMFSCRVASACTLRELAPRDVPDALARGLVSPVRFAALLELLAGEGVTDVVVAAPSRVVRSLVRRVLGDRVAIHAAGDPESLDAVATRLAQPPRSAGGPVSGGRPARRGDR